MAAYRQEAHLAPRRLIELLDDRRVQILHFLHPPGRQVLQERKVQLDKQVFKEKKGYKELSVQLAKKVTKELLVHKEKKVEKVPQAKLEKKV